ncbi:GspE/PulE family protein [Candidatus Auribacterota bacterium]
MKIFDLEEYLLEKKLVNGEQLAEAKSLSKSAQETLTNTLVKLDYLTEKELLKIIACGYDLNFAEKISPIHLSLDLINRLPLAFLKKNRIVPFDYQKNCLKVATANPLDLHLVDSLRSFFSEAKIEVVVSPSLIIEEMLRNLFEERDDPLSESISALKSDINEAKVKIKEDKIDLDSPLVKLVNDIILQGVKLRATDIHIHPANDTIILRYRVDGMLFDYQRFPKKFLSEVISRIKIMANLDITETKTSQDGRFSFDGLPNKMIDLRVSIIPTACGERVVLRMLDKDHLFIPLAKLGFSLEQQAVIEKYSSLPNGMLLVTGPTGSGKTTTLYACLERLSKGERNIITIEDPIEYQLEGVAQMQIAPKKGVTFLNGLRAILRQDPDIMMIGEIRDNDTAKIAIRSSLTGHLILSTLHTNDTVQSIIRLIDIGVEPYLVASSVSLIISQRLIRLLCPKCKESLSKEENDLLLKRIGKESDSDIPLNKVAFYKPKGCSECLDTGFKGRMAIYELLEVNSSFRKLIHDQPAYEIFKEYLQKDEKFASLKTSGIKKVLEGLTTLDEIFRVTSYI